MPNLVQLSDLRTAAKQRANREGDDDTLGFITKAEWNTYINASWRELYDLLVTRYQDQYAKASASFAVTGATDTYSWTTLAVSDLYKALGVDMLVGQTNYWQPLKRFNFAERGQGNPLSPLVAGVPGLYDLRYQLRGDGVVFMQPVPSATCRLWYIPVAPAMVADGDTIDDVNGYGEYVIVDAAMKALVKEDTDVSQLAALKGQLRERILTAASNRDAGGAETISDTSDYGWWP